MKENIEEYAAKVLAMHVVHKYYQDNAKKNKPIDLDEFDDKVSKAMDTIKTRQEFDYILKTNSTEDIMNAAITNRGKLLYDKFATAQMKYKNIMQDNEFRVSRVLEENKNTYINLPQ